MSNATLKNVQRLILQTLQESGPMTEQELADALGYNQSTINRNAKGLIQLQYIMKNGLKYVYRTKWEQLKKLKEDIQPKPSPIFQISNNTLAVEIDPRYFRLYETNFRDCFHNPDFPNENEIFALTLSGSILYLHLWDSTSKKKGEDFEASPIEPDPLLHTNIHLVKEFFSENVE